MKLNKKDIFRISDLALTLYKDQPTNLSWDKTRDYIEQSELRTLAYLEAAAIVLKLDIDIEHYKPSGKGYAKN